MTQQIQNEFVLIESSPSSVHFRGLPENVRCRVFSSALRPQSAHKNRYPDILPYEHSLVRLQYLGHEGSDYMNANYIFGGQYISCQAPLFSTINDFWRMVWEQNCPVIVMLTRLLESGKMKANIYWPLSSSCSLRFGDIEVTLLEEDEKCEHFIQRHFLLRRGQEVREVHHLHYTEWSDFGAPTSTEGIRDLISASNDYRDSSNSRGPMVVHCSAGIGRAGTFIAIHQALERLEQGLDYNVKDLVLHMREQRWGMVQTEKQYSFIHRAINDHLSECETEPYFSSSDDDVTMSDSPSSLSPRTWSPNLKRNWRNTSNDCVPTLQIPTATITWA